MKKILILGMSATLGGIETYIYNLIKNINKEQYDFDFLVVDNNKSVFQDEINHILGDNREHFFYAPNLKKEHFKAKKWLVNFYDNHRYDMIYMNTCTAARINYCLYAIRKYKTPLITHSHSGNATSKIQVLSNRLYRRKCTKLSSVKLACSEVAYRWLFTDDECKDSIVPNGVDLERFGFKQVWRDEIRQKLGISENEILIGNVGRISPQKNQKYLLTLCKMLEKKYRIMIIGDGELKESMEQDIERLDIAEKIILLPATNDIEKYYSAMDIFVMPSVFEGLPIVGIEAQAEGLPCIFSTNISQQTGLSEFSRFVDLDDIDGWLNAIKEYSGMRYNGKMVVKNAGFDCMRPVKKIESTFCDLEGSIK